MYVFVKWVLRLDDALSHHIVVHLAAQHITFRIFELFLILSLPRMV